MVFCQAGSLERPVFLALAHVCCVTFLGSCFGCVEKFLCLCGACLLERQVTHFAHEEVLELAPIRLFGVERERILALCLEFGVEAP